MSEVILKVNDSKTFVIGHIRKEIYKELKNSLGYADPSAIWKSSQSNKWDGIVTTVCYSKKYCKCSIKEDGIHFPTGLLGRACEFFRAYAVPYKICDERNSFPLNQINIGTNTDFEFRDYQQSLIEKSVNQQRGIIKVATGGGKTSIGAGIISKLGISPFIFYVTSQDLLKQAKSELERFLNLNGNPLKVGVIGAGKCDIRDVNIMTVQTAVRALGEKFQKFDDEDGEKEDDVDVSRYESIANLIRSAKGIISDEVQHWAAKTCQVIADNSISARYRYGLSIGPQSFVELKGGVFGKGFHGSIEAAWDMLCENHRSYIDQEYEIINTEKISIQSRGWNGKEFCWKKLNKFIRHIGPNQLYSVRFRGKQELHLTGDHSVFRVERDSKYEVIHSKKKFYGKIVEIETEKLNIDDILLQDNGNNWGGKNEEIDTLYCLSNFYSNPSKIRVRCDLSNISHEQLNLSPVQFHQICSRNPNGSSVNILQYLGMQNSIKNCPSVDFLYTEGAHGIGIHRFIPIVDLAYLLGFYIGDGWFDGNRVNFAVEKARVDNFLERIAGLKWLVCNPTIREMNGESVEVRINNALLVCILKQILKTAKCYDKRLSPEWIMSWPKESRRNLLEGLIDSDGSRINKPNKTEVRYTTTSFGLSQDVMSLVRSLGGRPSLSIRKPSKGGFVDGRQIIGKRASYQVIWAMSCLDESGSGHYGAPKKFLYNEENLHEIRVREIAKIPFSGYVYDFEMEGHPSFVANGVLVHNSATPWRDLGDDLLIDACFGKLIGEINASFLIKKGVLVRPTIYFVHTNKRIDSEATYATAYEEGITKNEERNTLIANIAHNMVSQGRCVLLLAKHISHGETLEKMIPNSVFLNGSHTNKTRYDHIELMRNNKAPITIASSIFDEGVDVKSLDGLILAGSGKSQTRALQRVGRVIRSYTNPITGLAKKDAYVVDFYDNMKYMKKHSEARRRIYETEPEFLIKDFNKK